MWALYCLGQYRDIQEQLHDEIVTNCGTEGPVVPETFATMPLLDRVLKEAQRLYPTVPFIGRTLVHPIEIG